MGQGTGQSCASCTLGCESHLSPLLPGVDVEAAKRAEEELLLHDTRCWLNGGAMPEARHPRTGASALHVAAAKGYIEVMR